MFGRSERTSRRLGAIIGLPLTAVLLAGCAANSGSAAPSPSTGKPLAGQTWAYGSVTDASPMFKGLGDSIVAGGTKLGAKMLRYDNNIDPSTALSNGRLMVQQGANFAIDWAAGSTNDALGGVFKAGKVPCVAINTRIPNCSFYNIDTKASGTGLGNAMVTQAKAKGWTAANTTLLLVTAVAGGEDDHRSLEYFYSTYAAAFPAMKQLKPAQVTLTTTAIGDHNGLQVDGGGTLEGAFSAVTTGLASIPADRNLVVYANNDDMATGALQAIAKAGRTSNTLLAAQGSTPQALSAVRSGSSPWVAEYSLFLDTWPQYLVAIGLALQAGKHVPALTNAPGAVVTQKTVDTYFTPSGAVKKAPSLPEGDSYLIPYLSEAK